MGIGHIQAVGMDRGSSPLAAIKIIIKGGDDIERCLSNVWIIMGKYKTQRRLRL